MVFGKPRQRNIWSANLNGHEMMVFMPLLCTLFRLNWANEPKWTSPGCHLVGNPHTGQNSTSHAKKHKQVRSAYSMMSIGMFGLNGAHPSTKEAQILIKRPAAMNNENSHSLFIIVK